MSWVGGILLGVASSGVTWLIFVFLSHPRLRWSRQVVEQAMPDGLPTYRVKLMNVLPWSAISVELEAFLILKGVASQRAIVRVPATESRIPLLGGAWLRTWRRRRYGWMGASHRVITIFPGSLGTDDERRMRPEDVALLRDCTAGQLAQVLGTDGELMLCAQAIDGTFFGDGRRCMRVYRANDVVPGSFTRGRSLAVAPSVKASADG